MKSLKKEPFLFLFLLLFYVHSSAQIVVSEATSTAEEEAIVNALVGAGCTVSNINVECGTGNGLGNTFYAMGSFGSNDSEFELESGMLLTTGSAKAAEGPNQAGTVSNSISEGNPINDEALAALSSVSLNDICRVTVDVSTFADSLSFYYMFGSEEYYGFTASSFNDVFGFFISGPNPDGGFYENVNIALIPGSDPPMPVSINTVNGGCNTYLGPCSPSPGPNEGELCPCNEIYFIDNDFTEDETAIQYRGYTRPLKAFANVIPCETYTLTMVIADGTDTALDSGVFIQSGSLESQDVSLQSSTGYKPFSDGQDVAVENCLNAEVELKFPIELYDDALIYYSLIPCENGQDMITNGLDIALLAGVLEAESGLTSKSFEVQVLEDDSEEEIECFRVQLDSIRISDRSFGFSSKSEKVQIIDQSDVPISEEITAPCEALIGAGLSLEADKVISIYPNPSKGIVHFEGINDRADVQVFDLNGQLVFQQNNVDLRAGLNLSSLEKGLYYLTIQDRKRNVKSFQSLLLD